MPKLKRNLTINAPSDAVWSVLERFMQIDEFAPQITRVDALTTGENGRGSKRRNHFENGSSLVEEVTNWQPGKGYTVKLSDLGSMPLQTASSEIQITPTGNRSSVTWSFEFKAKYGPIGWVMGQLLMKPMMGKVITANLKGLDATVLGK